MNSLWTIAGLSVIAVLASGQAPEGCPVCKGDMAFGGFADEIPHVAKYEVPSLVLQDSDARDEPWVFELTVDVQGRVCSLKLKRGPENRVERSIAEAVRTWQFTAWRGPTGREFCFQSLFFAYIRRREGRLQIVFPGLNGPL